MTAGPEYPMTTVRKDDLDILVVACLKYLPDDPEDISPDVRMALSRLDDARQPGPETAEAEEVPLPDGFFGRVELPGWRNHTGWVTEETRFGAQVAVIRDWNGAVVAEVCIGPMCQVVHLPTPLKRPDAVAAIAPSPWDGGHEDEEDEEDEGYDEGDGLS